MADTSTTVRLPERGNLVVKLNDNPMVQSHGPLPNAWTINLLGDAAQDGEDVTALVGRDPSGAAVALVCSRADQAITPSWTTAVFE